MFFLVWKIVWRLQQGLISGCKKFNEPLLIGKWLQMVFFSGLAIPHIWTSPWTCTESSQRSWGVRFFNSRSLQLCPIRLTHVILSNFFPLSPSFFSFLFLLPLSPSSFSLLFLLLLSPSPFPYSFSFLILFLFPRSFSSISFVAKLFKYEIFVAKR